MDSRLASRHVRMCLLNGYDWRMASKALLGPPVQGERSFRVRDSPFDRLHLIIRGTQLYDLEH